MGCAGLAEAVQCRNMVQRSFGLSQNRVCGKAAGNSASPVELQGGQPHVFESHPSDARAATLPKLPIER
jgi:hypothetical protein